MSHARSCKPSCGRDTTVDYDHGLNKAVSKVREALGDSAEHARFVETVASRGYRFLADVAVVSDPSDAKTIAADAAPARSGVDVSPIARAAFP